MKISHVINEGMAQDEAEETNGWRAELVNQINYNTFEVKMTNARSKESANFIVRPVDMISIGPTLQIETMDVHDLQTGQTASWTSDDPQPDGGIVYAIAMMFWDNKELQKKLWTIVDQSKDQDLMPGLNQRRSIGQEVDADAYIDSQEKTQDVMAKMKQGTLKEFSPSGAGRGGGNYFKTLASAWYNGAFDTGSLQKGIKSKEDVERLLQRGIVCPDGVTRKFGIDYNAEFDGVVISSDDYYEHSDHGKQPGTMIDVRTGQAWGPYDYMEFKDAELDEEVEEGVRVPAQQILGTKNRAKSAYYPTNVKPKVPKLDKPLTDQELARLSQLAGIKSK